MSFHRAVRTSSKPALMNVARMTACWLSTRLGRVWARLGKSAQPSAATKPSVSFQFSRFSLGSELNI